jgi:hypothetical protein
MSNIVSYQERLENFDWPLAENELEYRHGEILNIGSYYYDRICLCTGQITDLYFSIIGILKTGEFVQPSYSAFSDESKYGKSGDAQTRVISTPEDADEEIYDDTPLISSRSVNPFSLVSLLGFIGNKFNVKISAGMATYGALDSVN